MKKPISLATDFGEKGTPVAAMDAESTSYPAVYLTFDEDEDPDLPKQGTITFKYRLAGCRESFKNGSCAYDLDLTDIVDVTKGKEVPGKQSAEEAMDEYASEKSDKD